MCLDFVYYIFFILLSPKNCFDIRKTVAHSLLQHHKFEYDGFNLKDGREIIVNLAAKRPRDYFLPVPTDGLNILLVVTPCGGMVKWKLVQQHLAAENEWFMDDSDDWFQSNDSYSKKTQGKFQSLKLRQQHDLWRRQQSDRYATPLRLPLMETMLVKEVGSHAMEYTRENMPTGNLHLYLLAAENETLSARVYAATIRNGDTNNLQYFPKLPRRKRVHLLNITKTSVAVSWEHSPSVNLHKYFGVEYCLVLSSTRHYSTLCDYEEQTKQKASYSNLQNSNAIRFSASRLLLDERYQKYLKDPVLKCTRFKTEYFFDRLKPDTKYHLSLFAINVATGGSIAYDGASFVSRSEGLYSNTVIKIVDGQMYASYLNPTRSSFRLYEIIVDKFRRHLMITVQPCSGYLRLNLYKDGQILRKSIFEDLKSFIISNVQPGVIRVKVINDDNESKLFKIWASRRASKNPYPRLPVDPSLKAPENGRTCRSIELMWLTATNPGPHIYRLYERTEEEGYFKRLILEQANQCHGPSPQARLVFERRINDLAVVDTNDRQSKDNLEEQDYPDDDKHPPTIMTEKVTGLKPETTYRFDLYVSKPNRQQLSYRTIWVKTRTSCDDGEETASVQSTGNSN